MVKKKKHLLIFFSVCRFPDLNTLFTSIANKPFIDGEKTFVNFFCMQVPRSSYSNWIRTLRSGLSKVQESSVQLLREVDDIEVRQESDRLQLLREIAKLEFNMSKSADERAEESALYRDRVSAEHNLAADLRNLREEVTRLRSDLATENTDTIARVEELAELVFKLMAETVGAAEGEGRRGKHHRNRHRRTSSHQKKGV